MEKEKLYLTSPLHDVITIYISKTANKQKMLDLLKREENLISNIKSRETRQAIECAFQKVKSFLLNPPASENGYIIVASESDFAWTDEIPVTRDWYRCGNSFYSEPLEQELAIKLHPIGIICLDTKEATIGRVSNEIEILKYMTSGIPGKSHKGGQSQRRYERERDMAVAAFFKRVGDAAKLFVDIYPIEELLISGCGQTKEDFIKAKYLDYRLKEKVTMVLDTQYTDESGIRETLQKALPLLQENAYAKEVQVVEKVFETLGKNFDSTVYGKDEILNQLHLIEKIIMIEEMENKEILQNFKGAIVILHSKGTEHYLKISSLGGIIGIKKTLGTKGTSD